MQAVLDHGQYLNGIEVQELEEALAQRAGVPHVVSCASGTDALVIALRALGIGPGDCVFVPAFTFIAPVEAIVLVGARPCFVDVDAHQFTMAPAALEQSLTEALRQGLRPRAILPVDLFGLPAPYPALLELAQAYRLDVLADCAQSFGACIGEKTVLSLNATGTTSFFPSKPLGAYGDAGAIFLHDASLAELCRSIREHGKGVQRYQHDRLGFTGRMDTLQAAVLLEKLKIFDEELEERQRIAERYHRLLEGSGVSLPRVPEGFQSTWALYTILASHEERRDQLRRDLDSAGIPSVVYYPRLACDDPPYRSFVLSSAAEAGAAEAAEETAFPVARALTQRVLSLPMHPYLTAEEQARIAAVVQQSQTLHREADAAAELDGTTGVITGGAAKLGRLPSRAG